MTKIILIAFLFACSSWHLLVLRRLFSLRAWVKGEVAIREAQSQDRTAEPGGIGTFEIKAWLHDGAGKGRADTPAISAQGANWHGAVTCQPYASSLDETLDWAVIVDSGHPSGAIKAGVGKQLSDDELTRLGGSHFASDGGQCNRQQPDHHRKYANHGYLSHWLHQSASHLC